MQREASFGAWLKQRRSSLGLTQDRLARLIHCSPATIQKLESGLRRPSTDIAALLAKHLDLPPAEHAAFIGFARGERPGDLFDKHTDSVTDRLTSVSWKVLNGATNLPLPLTPFIGRTHEVTMLGRRFTESQARLLTLTGPAGVGKTRLALEIASQVIATFADGVFFVTFDSVADPARVAQSILHALQVVENPQLAPSAQLLTHFRDQHTLLILDTFEHLVSAAPLMTDLLSACPWLHILVTSRVPLRVRGEHQYAVHPLPVPAPDQMVPFDQMVAYDSIALFVNRTQAIKSAWQLTPETAPAVIEICQRLDGLPLAIELATAQSGWLSPHALLHQLRSHSSILFAHGFRDGATRQQTLHQAIAWSYQLLDPATQRLFARLAVFAGGWTLEAALAIGDQDARGRQSPGDSQRSSDISRLSTLVEHSLVRQEETPTGEVRFTMLQTIHAYASEQLATLGDTRMMQAWHAHYYRDVAEQMEPLLRGEQQLAALQALEQEYGNFQAALAWYQSVPHGVEDGLRLAGALGEFWFICGNFVQGHAWLQAFLEREGEVPLAVRAKALRYAAVLASPQGKVELALRWNHESLAVHRGLGDHWGVAYTLAALGDVQVWHHHDAQQGQALLAESLRLARTIKDPWLLGRVAWRAGMYKSSEGRDDATAQVLLEESLAAASSIQDLWGMSNALPHVAYSALIHGEQARAAALLDQALTLAHMISNQRSVAITLNILGMQASNEGKYDHARTYHEDCLHVAQAAHLVFQQAAACYFLGATTLQQGQYREAHTWLIASLKQYHTLNVPLYIPICLVGLAAIACQVQYIDQAAQLLGTAARLIEMLDIHLTPTEQRQYDEALKATRTYLDRSLWMAAWEAGQAKCVEHVIEEVDQWNLPTTQIIREVAGRVGVEQTK